MHNDYKTIIEFCQQESVNTVNQPCNSRSTECGKQVDCNLVNVHIVGSCIICDDSVIEQNDRFICLSALSNGTCDFSITKDAIKDVVSTNIIDYVADFIILNEADLANLVSDLLSNPAPSQTTWHSANNTMYEYYEQSLVKTDDGKWTIKITRDNPELEALAKTGYLNLKEILDM